MKVPIVLLSLSALSLVHTSLAATVQRIPDEATGLARAVVVTDSALAHTAQFMALDAAGAVVGKGDPVAQALQILDRLESTFQACRSDLDKAVLIDVYVKSPEAAAKVRDLLQRKFAGPNPPAVSFVETPLPRPDAEVAMDAIVATPLEEGSEPLKLKRPDSGYGDPDIAHAGLLPRGPALYVSGQAEEGPLALATRKTLQSLENTLEFLGLDLTRVAQVKAFLSPMSQAEVVREEIDAFFGKVRTPPLVLVEWKSSHPIEIELIAADKAGEAQEGTPPPIEYLTPPGMEASPIFSRIARVNSPSRIYVSGLTGEPGTQPGKQIETIFGSLKGILETCGSDLRHLAKATYYISDDGSSAKLNELRPQYYDPERPPAASKAMVQGVGVKGCSVALDMVAVPIPK